MVIDNTFFQGLLLGWLCTCDSETVVNCIVVGGCDRRVVVCMGLWLLEVCFEDADGGVALEESETGKIWRVFGIC